MMDDAEESKLTDCADGERKEQEGVPQEPSDMFRVVTQFIEKGGDAHATADRAAEWLATRAEAWHDAHTFREDDSVVGHGLDGEGTGVRALAEGQVGVDTIHGVVVLSASSLWPVLQVNLVADGQASRLKQLYDDARLSGMWDVFVVWCT